MPKRITRLLLASVLVLPVGAGLAAATGQQDDAILAAGEQQSEPSVDFIHEATDLEADPRVIYGVLDNGLRYAVMKNETPGGVAALRMRIATGSLNETEEQRGLAHFLEHMAFNGSENVPEGEMIKRLERYGLSFGADTNASTGFDQTTYKLNLPTVEEEVLDEAFFLMRETADKLVLDEEAIERERGVIASEKAARDSIEFRILVERLGFFTQGSGLVERLPIGVNETIATMPREEFVKYYRGYYRPENTFIVFAGDIEPDEAIARIEEYFGDWQPIGPALPQRHPKQGTIAPGSVGVTIAEGQMTFATLATMRPYEERIDSVQKRRDNLVRSLGMRILNERMARKVEDGSAVYLAAMGGRFQQDDVVDGMTLRMRTSPEDWQAALADGEQDLRRAIEYGFTQQELDEQLARTRRSLETAVERADTLPTFATGFGYSLVDALVGAFANERVFTSQQSGLERFEAIETELTLEEVNQAFREAWAGFENPSAYFVSSEPLEDAEEVIAATIAASKNVAVAPLDERAQVGFAYTDFGNPGTVVSEVYLEDADAYLIKFDNNVRLNFKKTDFEDDNINLRLRVGDGFMSLPRKDEGLRRLGLNVLNKSGVVGHTESDLRTIFAGRRVFSRTQTRIDNDAFEILGATGHPDMSALLEVMTARVTAPAFREEVAEQYFRSMQAWYPTHDSNPSSVVRKYLPRLIRSGDRRYGYDGLDSFLSPTLEEVRAWIEPELSSGLIELTVVGDVDKDMLVEQVARTLGALPQRADAKADFGENAQLRFPDGRDEPSRFYHRGAEEQALVYVYWPARDASDPADTYRMRLLRSIFRNRLTDVLREEMGSTYSPGASAFSSRLFDDYGYVVARVTADPADVERVRDGILRVASEMASEGVSDDAFERALNPLVEDIDSTLEKNSYWIGVLGDAQTGADGLARFRAQSPTYENATAEEISAVAREVFGNAQSSVSAYILPDSLKPDGEALTASELVDQSGG